MADIYRRIVLTDARNKLKSSYGIKTLKSDDSVEKCVEDFLLKVTEKDSALLTAGTLATLFDTSDGSIYTKGNIAAHEATFESKLFAIFACGDSHNLLKLFIYAYYD